MIRSLRGKGRSRQATAGCGDEHSRSRPPQPLRVLMLSKSCFGAHLWALQNLPLDSLGKLKTGTMLQLSYSHSFLFFLS